MFTADTRFEILRQIGSGGYGVVYEAVDRSDGSKVALKVLHEISAEAEARFEREAVLLSLLAHPSIIRYVAHGRIAERQSYLAMEWLEGCTLDKFLETRLLTTTEVVTLIRRLTAGLIVASQHGVMHRDIKPENLFLPGERLEDAKISTSASRGDSMTLRHSRTRGWLSVRRSICPRSRRAAMTASTDARTSFLSVR